MASLNPRMTVGRTIAEPMKIFGLYDRRTRQLETLRLMELVGLNPRFLNRYPHEFSGGQRQRICIARALTVEPEFIICDEAVSALDVSVQAQVLNLLKSLQEKRGLTYAFISHDLSVVKFMADMMAVMQGVEEDGQKHGRIVEFGPSEAIYAHPKQQYTRDLINAAPKDDLGSIRRRQSQREAALAKRRGNEGGLG
jgi:peptide/nickel transport system ATP-binding protein